MLHGIVICVTEWNEGTRWTHCCYCIQRGILAWLNMWNLNAYISLTKITITHLNKIYPLCSCAVPCEFSIEYSTWIDIMKSEWGMFYVLVFFSPLFFCCCSFVHLQVYVSIKRPSTLVYLLDTWCLIGWCLMLEWRGREIKRKKNCFMQLNFEFFTMEQKHRQNANSNRNLNRLFFNLRNGRFSL